MKFVCISDLHGLQKEIDYEIPYGDVLLIAGDITGRGRIEEVELFNDWLKKLPHPYKICIAGNHDWCFEKEKVKSIKALTEAVYLEDSFVEINEIKIYGSPWTPKFYNWAFMKKDYNLSKIWRKIPDDTDILLTHGPASNCFCLDFTGGGDYAGSKTLYEKKLKLKKLKAHIFGHIHEAYGTTQYVETGEGFFNINASICNLHYQPINEPITFIL